eukprot:TRINITY_DN17163_c0_g1_i1.p1 TRINITY_DN17163_c0_g1~~TRINITY_DN17163_c0_g1_i1.p1  ORF type:complete len:437 (-),score=68.05 TRINITY_DN17163_c0_g1_i1:490-1800(-)
MRTGGSKGRAPLAGRAGCLLPLLRTAALQSCFSDVAAASGQTTCQAGRDQVLVQTMKVRGRFSTTEGGHATASPLEGSGGPPPEVSSAHEEPPVLGANSLLQSLRRWKQGVVVTEGPLREKGPAIFADGANVYAGAVVQSLSRLPVAPVLAGSMLVSLVFLLAARLPTSSFARGDDSGDRAGGLPAFKASEAQDDDDEDAESLAGGFSPSLTDKPNFDLVAPEGGDYSLTIPLAPLDGGPFSIEDGLGNAVLVVHPRGPSACRSPKMRKVLSAASPMSRTSLPRTNSQGSKMSQPVHLWRLLVTSPEDKGVVAQCFATGSGSTAEFHLRRADGSDWAKLTGTCDHDYRFSLKVVDGSEYVYHGDYVDPSMCITSMKIVDKRGTTIATTSPCGDEECAGDDSTAGFYKLRARPGADAGLLLCGVFCIQWHISSVFGG